jgi:hypothetical protein
MTGKKAKVKDENSKEVENKSQDAEEEEDEDYKEEDTEADGDEEDQMQVDETTNQNSTELAFGKRKDVDESFERLFGYKWGTEFDFDENKAIDSQARMLVEIFGPTQAARILMSTARGSKRQKMVPALSNTSSEYITINLPKSRPQTVIETKVFAGQAVKVTRQQTEEPKPAVKASGSSLDKVLAQLAGPAKISTVAKTSEDWEQFKQSDKQLQEEIEKKAQGKDAFLVKADFNSRVDVRKFQLEKDERDRERAKRGT